MTNGDRVRQMSDEELVEFIIGEDSGCKFMNEQCSSFDDCGPCTLKYLKMESNNELMESKRDGYFECDMSGCMYQYKSRCTNPCYMDCPHYSLKNSLRELVSKYEEIVKKI